MGRLVGIEPTSVGATIRCVNHFAIAAINLNLAGVVGIEPTSKVLETFVLPLNYTPKWWWGTDSNRRTRRERIYSPPRLATSLPHHDFIKWWLRTESNRRHKDFQSFALPTELLSLITNICKWRSGRDSNPRPPA